MNPPQPDWRRLSPETAMGWLRLLVAGLFAFHLNYVPIHLAAVEHSDDVSRRVAERPARHHSHEPGHGHGHDHHHRHAGDAGQSDSDENIPHPASDHTLTLTARLQVSGAVALPVVSLSPSLPVTPLPPTRAWLPLVSERIPPLGESPPDPLRPRAPPSA